MNYKIIKDIEELKKFIDWLPELKDSEQFYYSLFARSKYDSTGTLKADKGQLKRGTSTKERLIGKIKKLETSVGSYDIKGIEIPQETLALYINPNPRCFKKASIVTLKMLADNIGNDKYQNPHSIALNAVQVSKSRTFRVDFDFDINNQHFDKHIKDTVYEAVGNTNCFDIIKTRGGYHVLIDPSEATEKRWFQNLTKEGRADQSGDLLLPVPGCCQGGFVPHFLK